MHCDASNALICTKTTGQCLHGFVPLEESPASPVQCIYINDLAITMHTLKEFNTLHEVKQ